MTRNTATDTSSSTTNNTPLGLAEARPLIGWRHSATWTYLIMLIASAVALGASLILSAETLQLARHPESVLGCDLNSVVSCSTVARSWQAEIVGLARVKVPRWFATCTWLGGLAALAYSYWLSTQSLFVIHALCPWCLTLMFSTTIQFMALSHATVAVQGLPSRKAVAADDSDGEAEVAAVPAGLNKYYRLNIDLMVDILWIVAIVVLIIVTEGAALFAA